jgi:hypothetical protein
VSLIEASVLLWTILVGDIGFDGYALCCLFLPRRGDPGPALSVNAAMQSDRSGAAQPLAFSFSLAGHIKP